MTNSKRPDHPTEENRERDAGERPTDVAGEGLDHISPRVIGHYKLLQLIATGGMGQVWMAEQEKPVRRRVALKLIKAGMDSKPIVARFEAERQALAMMDHQNIAKVLDAGTTEQGQPYFVMELVQGIPITKYCDSNKLDIDDRLKLFISVCHAIQHAHQKGIIHRDLKPSNILVTINEGSPMAKVIDFGLAKALEHQSRLTDKTLFTEFGQVVGTLQYMSPEQAELNAMDSDTRSDIYSLGVLLYELLTGSTPIDRETLERQAVFKILETIRETDPPRPSDRLGSSADMLAEISHQRQIDPQKFSQILKGDLDWIVMKALEKDRTRRYESANGFADDVRRYLEGDAVVARPPSKVYRLKKLVRKNRSLVAVAAAFVSLLLVATCVASILGLIADSARRTAIKAQADAVDEQFKAEESRKDAENAGAIAIREAERATQAERAALHEAEIAKKAVAETQSTLARSNFFLAQYRWNENRITDAQDLLQSIPKEHRHFEWDLAVRMFEGGYMSLYGHASDITSIGFSPDGARLATSSSDHTVKIWDTRYGRELMTLRGHKGPVSGVAFCSQNGHLATASADQTVKLWDPKSGRELLEIKGDQPITSLAFSNDAMMLALGQYDGHVKIWNPVTGQELRTIRRQQNSETEPFGKKDHHVVSSLSFSPDGKRLAAAYRNRSLKIFETHTGREVFSSEAEIYWAASVMFSPDGTKLAAGFIDGTIQLLNPFDGKELRTLKGSSLLSVAFSPDGSRLASGGDGTIRLWDVRSGQELQTLKGHTSSVTCVTFSPDGARLASGSFDSIIKFWDVRNDQDSQILKTFEGILGRLDFSPDGTLLACLHGSIPSSTLTLLDARTGMELWSSKGNGTSIDFSPDGTKLVVGSIEGGLKLLDVRNGEMQATIKGHSRAASCVSFSPDGNRLASGSMDNTVKLWDGNSLQEIASMQHKGIVSSLAFNSDGTRLATGGHDGTVRLWDARNGEPLWSFNLQGLRVQSLAFSADGQRLACAYGMVTLLDVHSGTQLTTLKVHLSSINGIVFSPDDRLLVSNSSDGSVKIWDANTGQELLTLQGRKQPIKSVAFSPDGKRLAAIDGSVRIWNASGVGEVSKLKGHSNRLTCLAFSPDGTRLISGSYDKSLKIWDALSGQLISTLSEHKLPIREIAFSHDGLKFTSIAESNDRSQSERFVWNVVTGKRLEEDSSATEVLPSNQTQSGSKLSVPLGNEIGIVDLAYKDSPAERQFRESRAKTDLGWHAVEARIAQEKEDWYSSAFHRAMQMSVGQPNVYVQLLLKKSVEKWLSERYREDLDRKSLHLSKESIPPMVVSMIDANSKWSFEKGEMAGIDRYVRSIVLKPLVDDLELGRWKRVRRSEPNVVEALVKMECTELDLLSHIAADNNEYLNTLGIAYYRLEEYSLAIETLLRSCQYYESKNPKRNPANAAFLALSYLKLGKLDQASKFRLEFEEAIKGFASTNIVFQEYNNRADILSFAKEIEEAFAKQNSEKSDR